MRKDYKDMMQIYENAAVVGCIEAHGIEPTRQQIDKAIEITKDKESRADGLFMFGCELTAALIKIVEDANGIPMEQSALNYPKLEKQWQRKCKQLARRMEYYRLQKEGKI